MATPTIAMTKTGSGSATTSGTLDLTTASGSIAVGDVITVRIAATTSSVRTLTVTGGGLTWTNQKVVSNGTSAGSVYIATAIAASTTPFVITTTFNASQTWQASADVLHDTDGAPAVDVSDSIESTTSTTPVYAAQAAGINTAAYPLVLSVNATTASRTFTAGTGYTAELSGTSYHLQRKGSTSALTGERPSATPNTSCAYTGACISVIGNAPGGATASRGDLMLTGCGV